MRRHRIWLALGLLAATPTLAGAQEPGDALLSPRETAHLSQLRQLTFGGENAEAYWSPDGKELILQSTHPPYDCDQIFRLRADGEGEPQLVSTGEGRTTCAYFTYPAGERLLYSSTHLAGPECPPVPDHSQGYVWALYPTYDIFSAALDGSDLVRLTENDVYDAEATICPLDGSIVFTSTRDGDLELYRMAADGSDVRRLTEAPGYDGGAFFSADCSKIVWRASRPQGEELEDFHRLLAQGLVRPSKLEIWVAESDGSDPRQITYLDAASFAPYFFPSGDRVIFSSNYGDPRGREFELWAVNVDGTGLERITDSPGFDGFPMFSPDGRYLAFSSNRNQGHPGDTNVFVARWSDGVGSIERGAADRYRADVAWLADDARAGRGLGSRELEEAGRWLAQRFEDIGLLPAGVDGGFLDPFPVKVAVEAGPATALEIDDHPAPGHKMRPASFSAQRTVEGEVVPAGYGISAPEKGVDDYEGVEVEGKIALVRRFVPPGDAFSEPEVESRFSDLRYKAFNAREHGAVGLLVVDLPQVAEGEELPEEAELPALRVDAQGDAGLPVIFISREIGASLFEGGHRARLSVELLFDTAMAHNVIGMIAAGAPEPLAGALLVGAHYDHLGMGGSGSLAPDAHEPHNGADDNASGVAAILEVAQELVARRQELRRDVFFVAFSGEESGLLGSSHLTREPPSSLVPSSLLAMLNLDMVGRLRENRLQILGGESAEEWKELVQPVCARLRLNCTLGGDGYGPSDHMPFYVAGVPVLHLFTGTHTDYHKPSDDTERILASGGARVASLTAELLSELAGRSDGLTYKEAAAAPPVKGDVRSYGASLGTIPDYTGNEEGQLGMRLAGVRPGGPAETAGMQKGDVLVKLAGTEIRDIYDLMYVLRRSKPGETVKATVERDGERVEMEVTFGVSRGRR